MCIAPLTIYIGPKGEKVPQEVACHECWQCRKNAIDDWVGRNIAESKTSKASHAVTLTYGRDRRGEVDHERASILTYSDVQKYLKLLRRHGYPVRYFVTGEFGSRKGRAHWHIMLYWQDKVPPHVLDENFMEEHWPHGWSFWTEPTPHAVRYNCKYIQKDMGEAERQGHLAMSKKPPLGALYFRDLAERYVRQGLSPQTLEYSFPDVKRRNHRGSHELVRFRLRDRSADLFLGHFMAEWWNTYGDTPIPKSPLLDEWFSDWADWGERDGRVVYLSRAEKRAEYREWLERLGPERPPEFVPPKPKGFQWMNEDDWWAEFERINGRGNEQQQEIDEWIRGREVERRRAKRIGGEDGYRKVLREQGFVHEKRVGISAARGRSGSGRNSG